MVTIDGMAQLGETGGTQFITNYQTLSGGFTKISGNHSIRWGGEFRLMRENTVNYGNGAPNMDFTAAWTKGPLDNRQPDRSARDWPVSCSAFRPGAASTSTRHTPSNRPSPASTCRTTGN